MPKKTVLAQNSTGDGMDLSSANVCVIGSGISGRAAAELAVCLGAQVSLLENSLERDDEELRAFADIHQMELKIGPHQPEDLAAADLIVLSPGIAVRKILPLLPEHRRLKPGLIISELQLAWQYSDAPVLAVTGSNGKTTTVTLAAEMLKASGFKVFLGGNIGTPLSAYMLDRMRGAEKADVLVLEVSSFQLQSCHGFRPEVAVFLNFSPNHLDWHCSLEEYLGAKLRIFEAQNKGDLAIVSQRLYDLVKKTMPGKGRLTLFDADTPRHFEAPYLMGRHNQSNIEAAYLATRYFSADVEKIRAMLMNFKGLPHRLEILGQVNGIVFINDSKSTSVDSLRAAVEALDSPTHLLAGGVFKGGDLTSLLPLMREKIKTVSLFGQSREIFEAAWSQALPVSWATDLETAMQSAFSNAVSGEAILLSPATASFDLYANYKARGDDFRNQFEQYQARVGH